MGDRKDEKVPVNLLISKIDGLNKFFTKAPCF